MAPAEQVEHGKLPDRRSDGGLVLVGVLGVDHLGIVLFGQTLLEAVDALAEVAHQVGDLAAAAKQDQGDGAQNQPVPDAERTHETSPKLLKS